MSKTLDYITFYRFHRSSLIQQHPRWTSNQITVIVKMLWQKEKAKRSMSRSMKGKSQVGAMRKKLSGRVTFKRFRNLNFNQAKSIWRHLPFESKIMWSQMGNPEFVKSDNSQKSFSMKLNGDEDRISNILMRRMGQ